MLEKVQSFADGKYDLSRKDVENIYLEQRGDAAEQIEELQIVKRMVSTAKMLQTHRQASGSGTIGRQSSLASRTSGLDRKTSVAGSFDSKKAEATSYAPPSRTVAAPPPYTSTPSSASITKKAPPPPPPLKPKPSYNSAQYATALFDYEAQVRLLIFKG